MSFPSNTHDTKNFMFFFNVGLIFFFLPTTNHSRGKFAQPNMTSNPFMVTSNECYGMSLPEASKRVYISPVGSISSIGNVQGDELSKENKDLSKQDMSFVYSRESDRFGEGCEFSDSLLSEVFRLKESDSMNKRRKFIQKELLTNCTTDQSTNSSRTISKEEVSEILSQYNHNPKVQHPLYHTTATEYGSKKPSEATFQNVRHGLSQQFSQSFNRTMFHNEGLNAAITKSKVHDSLV